MKDNHKHHLKHHPLPHSGQAKQQTGEQTATSNNKVTSFLKSKLNKALLDKLVEQDPTPKKSFLNVKTDNNTMVSHMSRMTQEHPLEKEIASI
mmetsp:Transcript_78336/g.169351  ORF Transcript_78336/g.169351 Transcript_78336/m.169351 type:complete len:93 (+) Transcript_78336:507-785(+)